MSGILTHRNTNMASKEDLNVAPSATASRKTEQKRSSTQLKPKALRENSKKFHKEKHQKTENHEKSKRQFKTHRNIFKDGGNEVDPLNIKKIINHDLPASPACNSPAEPRGAVSSLAAIQPLDVTDPLKLNSLDDTEVVVKTPKKKKKRKRRHTFQGDDDAEIKTVSLDELQDDVIEEPGADSLECNGKPSNPIKKKRNRYGSKSDDDAPDPKRNVTVTKVTPVVQPVTKTTTPVTDDTPQHNASESMPNKAKTEDPVSEEKDTQTDGRKYRAKDRKFIYGNYNRYYGYRNPNSADDDRIGCLKKDWFEGKRCLDVGCNVGHLTLWLARHYAPAAMLGVDIDPDLIRAANSNVRHYLSNPMALKQSEFPISLAICHGPLAAPVVINGAKDGIEPQGFPYNVSFVSENYVPLDAVSLSEIQGDVFDVILCLSVTKWVHLNFGDDALKRMFKKMYKQLQPGGRLVLEPQPFKSYKKKKNLTAKIRSTFNSIQFKPEHFIKYLLSDEVGFASSEVLSIPQHTSKGFQRPLYMLVKAAVTKTAIKTEVEATLTMEVDSSH